MDKSSAFVLPSGINLDVSSGSFCLEHSHDIHLEQTFGLPIGRIQTPANVVLQIDTVDGHIEAGGSTAIEGDVTGTVIAKAQVSISGNLSGEASSDEDVSIGGGATGTVSAKGTITVSGDAKDSTLHAGSDIQVDGRVEGGQLHASGQILIKGSVGTADLRAPKIVIDTDEVSPDHLDCEGELQITGTVDAKRITASEIHLTGTSVTVRAISATEKVFLGPGVMKIDVVIAPSVEIHPDTTGRITVIESQNISNVGAVKGGFSLAEYEDLFGDSTQFLQERGVHASGAATQTTPVPEDALVQEENNDTHTPDELDLSESEGVDLVSIASEDEPATEEIEEEIIEIVAAAVDVSNTNDDLHLQLVDAASKIQSCYDGMEVPQAIHDLQKLIDAKDYQNLRTNITEVWNGLLGFHQTKGIRPHHQVTHAFNVIHGLLQKTS